MLLHDTALVYGRYLRQSLRSRFALLFGVLTPLLYLLLYGPAGAKNASLTDGSHSTANTKSSPNGANGSTCRFT
ncbi:hypothetical protein ACWCQV_32740, partial [Streptomyces eurythermus]